MNHITIRDPSSGSQATIAPELGFNCYDFQAVVDDRTIAVLDASPEFAAGNDRPSGHGIPILFPFPNRIRHSKFVWDGKEYHLPDSLVGTNNGNAIHGFCLDRAWRVVDRGPQFVVGEFQLSKDAPDRLPSWPTDFILTVHYAVRDSTLECRITVFNPTDTPLPWGFGTHPYFKLPLAENSSPQQCLIEIPAAEEWELVDCLPTGTVRPVPSEHDFRDGEYFGITPVDDVLTGLTTDADSPFHETILYDEAAGLQVSQRFDRWFREVVVYSPPDRDAFCIEPYTCTTDAVNLQTRGHETGWQTLPPGGKVVMAIDIEAGLIVV